MIRVDGRLVGRQFQRLVVLYEFQFPVLVRVWQTRFVMSLLASNRLFRRFLTNYFGVLDEKVLDEIFSQCQWLELEGGDTLFSQGDVGDAAYFLISGRLCAIHHASVVVANI